MKQAEGRVLGVCLCLCALLVLTLGEYEDWSENANPPDVNDPNPTLSCYRRSYVTNIEQRDSSGKRCWGEVTLEVCYGRCDSQQIPDWRFPFKKSKHNVCNFGPRVAAVAVLEFCDQNVAPETKFYRYVKPVICRCRMCSSSDTNCEWLPMKLKEL